MKLVKRGAALLLAFLISFSTGYTDAFAASVTEPAGYGEALAPEEENKAENTREENTPDVETEEALEGTEVSNMENGEAGESTEVLETESEEPSQTEQTPEGGESLTEGTENPTEEPRENLAGETGENPQEESLTEETTTEESLTEETEEKAREDIGLVNFVVVEEPMVTTPGTQRIMTSIGDGTSEVESAVLTYENRETGESCHVNASEILDDFVLFTMDFPAESQAGTYQLVALTYSIQGLTTTTTFAKMGVDASFGVNEVPETEPDDVLLTEEEFEALSENVEANIVTLDEKADARTLGAALESAGCDTEVIRTRRGDSGEEESSVKGMSSIVVVLDPGHGGSDPGASGNGLVEKNLTLKIGQYCKEELEKYSGVTVVMTRESDKYLTLAQRAQVAIDNKATVFVSLHINSNTSSKPNGANVYYPNNNYNSSVGSIGKKLASIIESKLTDLGLASGGIHIRNSENSTKYPDGSLADYYGVIKRCKENGIPGLIVEHAFISNSGDASGYLNSDAKLKKLGVADAAGIADYYGLKKGVGFTSILPVGSDSLELTWKKVSGVSGYKIYRSDKKDGKFTKIATINSPDITNYKDTGLTPGKVYYYKMRTFTKTGSKTKHGSYSKVESGSTLANLAVKSIKSKNSKTLVISWTTVENVKGYEIQRATKKNGTYKQLATVNTQKQSSYTDKSVKAGKLYYYKVRSIGQDGATTVYSDWSEAVSGRTAKIPEKVKVASQSTTTLRVSWKGDAKAAGYVIKRATSKNGKYKKIATVKGGDVTYYDNKKVKAGKTYYYQVQAYNYNGKKKGYSGYSGTASGKTLKSTTTITKLVSTSPTTQTISWKKKNDVKGYQIYQSTSQDGTYKKIKTINNKKTTSYDVTGLEPGKKYFYKVRTTNKVNGVTGYSDFSAVRGAQVVEAVIAKAEGASGTKINLFWNFAEDAESYTIYRSDSADGSYQKIGTAEGSATGYTDSNLQMTKTYYYKMEVTLRGYKATGTSGLGSAVGASPVNRTEIASVERGNTGAFLIRWNQVADIAGYEIYRSTQRDGQYTLLTTVNDYSVTSYEDAVPDTSVSYWYKVRLVGSYNNSTVYGEFSAPVEGKIPETSGNPAGTP